MQTLVRAPNISRRIGKKSQELWEADCSCMFFLSPPDYKNITFPWIETKKFGPLDHTRSTNSWPVLVVDPSAP